MVISAAGRRELSPPPPGRPAIRRSPWWTITDELGGAGVNTGTVPSKTLRETALVLSGIQARKLVGVDLALKHETTVADFLRHEQNVKEGFNTMILRQLKADQADIFFGTGVVRGPAHGAG